MSVDPIELTGTQQAVLLVLMAEARPVPNPELGALGPELKKGDRDSLESRGLIEVTTGRPMTVELTDRGWATCARLIGSDVPPRVTGPGKAMYTVLRGLRRYFDREDLAPSSVFYVLDETAPEGSVEAEDVEYQVRAAYVNLAAHDGGWVDLVRLRDVLPNVSKHELDAALTRMYRLPDVSLVPQENQRILTDADREAAVNIGDQDKHRIMIGN